MNNLDSSLRWNDGGGVASALTTFTPGCDADTVVPAQWGKQAGREAAARKAGTQVVSRKTEQFLV